MIDQFEHTANETPDKKASGFYTGMLVKSKKLPLTGSSGSPGGELAVYLTDEEESITGDRLTWLLALLNKSMGDPQRRECAGHFSFSENTHKVFPELGQKDSYSIPNAVIQDSLYIGHTHANVSSNQLFPSQADLTFSATNGLVDYIVSSTHIVKVNEGGKISGIYNLDGNKTELSSFFTQNQINITEVSEPRLQAFTNPASIEAANPSPNLQIEGGFLDGEGSGQGQQEIVYLQDDMNNIHPLSRVNILWQNFTTYDGKKRLPKLFIQDENGVFTQEGAILVISYLNNDFFKPIIMGCLESLGAQNMYSGNIGSDLDFENVEEDSNINDDFELRRTVNKAGSVELAIKAKTKEAVQYKITIEGPPDGARPSMLFSSAGETYLINSNNSIQLVKDKIFIGAGEYQERAKEVGVNAERVILGTSTFLVPTVSATNKLFIDKGSNNQELSADSAVDSFNGAQLTTPKHQWAANAHAVVRALMEIIDRWEVTKYQSGNTICLVSSEDKAAMRAIRAKLPKILNKVVSLYNIPVDPVENYEGP